jgi:Response regulator receiver domain.
MSKILIIDDEKEIVDLLKDSLERKGNTVLTAYNGKEGIEKLKKCRIL